MVSSSNQPEQTFAREVASELNQPTRGKGVDRLAAALAAPMVFKHPAETPMRIALLRLDARTGAKSCKVEAELREDGQVKWWASVWFDGGPLAGKYGDTITEAVEACVTEAAEMSKRLAREATIRARIEREMAEADAAEAALKNTAPLAFVPDGSPADSLPIQSTVLNDPARMQELRDIERIDERDARMEERRRDEEEDAAHEGEKFDSGAD